MKQVFAGRIRGFRGFGGVWGVLGVWGLVVGGLGFSGFRVAARELEAQAWPSMIRRVRVRGELLISTLQLRRACSRHYITYRGI